MSTTDTRAEFKAWAEREGYDTAYTHDGIKWIWLNPMTADLSKAYQAATEAAKATADAEKDIRTKYADYFATIERAQELLRKIAELKFSEPAAKDTGTAGDLPEKNCPHCGTHEISLDRTCHNSACTAYANQETIYEGWKAQAKAARQPAPAVNPEVLKEQASVALIQRKKIQDLQKTVLDLRAALAATAAPVLSDEQKRLVSAALVDGDHLSTVSHKLLQAINSQSGAKARCEIEETAVNVEALERATTEVTEYWQAVLNASYEYTKRAARVREAFGARSQP